MENLHKKELSVISKEGLYFDRDWYKFTILKTWSSLSAIDKKSK